MDILKLVYMHFDLTHGGKRRETEGGKISMRRQNCCIIYGNNSIAEMQ